MYFLCIRKIHNLVLVTLLFEKQLHWDMVHIPWKPLFSSIQSVVFCIFSKVCNHYHNLILDNFITPKRNSIPIKSPFPPNPLPFLTLNNHQFTFDFYGFLLFGHFLEMESYNVWSLLYRVNFPIFLFPFNIDEPLQNSKVTQYHSRKKF